MKTKYTLRIFAYGTLKSGYGNHNRLCGGAVSNEPADIRGRLFGDSIAYLMVPEEDVLAEGSDDIYSDIKVQSSCNLKDYAPKQLISDWNTVFGELITFEDYDPENRIYGLDLLEGFNPAGHSFYHRVLLPVKVNTEYKTAWTYRIKNKQFAGREILSSVWGR